MINVINKNNLRNILLKDTKNTFYTLEDLLDALNFKKWSRFSYVKYDELRHIKPNLPSRSRIFKLEKN